jgi:hypothetical protein
MEPSNNRYRYSSNIKKCVPTYQKWSIYAPIFTTISVTILLCGTRFVRKRNVKLYQSSSLSPRCWCLIYESRITLSKSSIVKAKNVQLPETEETNVQGANQNANAADTWIKFIGWPAMMGVLLLYGMYQHDDIMLFGVMIVVTRACGYGNAVETLIKFLDAKGISLTKLPKN